MLTDLIHPSKGTDDEMDKKEEPTICCLQETHLTNRNKHRLRMKGWKKIY
jgi:hypothetical protein